MQTDRIILVYNADSGLFNAVSGWSHNLYSPETYDCPLCRITFGLTGMLVPWKNYLELLPFQKTYLHRDELKAKYFTLAAIPMPVILLEKNDVPEVLLAAEEIRAVGGVAGLIGLMQATLDDRIAKNSRA